MKDDLSRQLLAAKNDRTSLNSLIINYLPFIKKTVTGVFPCLEERNEALSEAMMGFAIGVETYKPEKGAFIPYCKVIIRNRLLNMAYKEAHTLKKRQQITGLDDAVLIEDAKKNYELVQEQNEIKGELSALQAELQPWSLALTDLIELRPKEARSMETCRTITACLLNDQALLQEAKARHKLPMSRLKAASGFSRKVLDKYRRYIVALMLVESGDYPCIRAILNMTDRNFPPDPPF
jgi:RNA polymerase sigma factor